MCWESASLHCCPAGRPPRRWLHLCLNGEVLCTGVAAHSGKLKSGMSRRVSKKAQVLEGAAGVLGRGRHRPGESVSKTPVQTHLALSGSLQRTRADSSVRSITAHWQVTVQQ